MYDQQKKIIIWLGATCFLMAVADLFLIYDRDMTPIRTAPLQLPKPLGCAAYLIGSPTLQPQMSWLPGIIAESVLFGMSAYKAYELSRQPMRQPLLTIIIQDSILYYFSILALMFTNMILGMFAPLRVTNLLLNWTLAVPCVVGSRLILNVRERVDKESATLQTFQTYGHLEPTLEN